MKKLRFHDGKFIIVQVADAQDLRHVRPTMIRMLNRAYDDLHPNLVVLTGDNILGNHLRDARIGTREVIHTLDGEREALRGAIAALCAPIEKRGIPFASISRIRFASISRTISVSIPPEFIDVRP